MAVRIGTAADMKGMTYSAMLAVCERAEALATVSAFGGGRDRKEEKIEALGDYMRALDREPTLFFHHRSLIKDLSRKVKRNLRKKSKYAKRARTSPGRSTSQGGSTSSTTGASRTWRRSPLMPRDATYGL